MSATQAAPAVVIGAGPAGLMAAEQLAQAGHAVVVLDRMPSPGRKLLMAGRGGLNLTHSEALEVFLRRYGADAPEALLEAVRQFPPARLVAWAEGLGIETFVGSSGRIFPRSLKASPLLRSWLLRLEALGVELRLRQRWTGWDENGALTFADDAGRPTSLRAAATVLAVGGGSWPRLGSDGRWVEPLRAAGVRISPLSPANAGVLVDWSAPLRERHAGAPLKRIAVEHAGKACVGEAVITRMGLEGGVIYALSRPLREALSRGERPVLRVDTRPGLALDDLERRLSAPRGKQSAANFLRKAAGLAPQAIALVREAGRGALPDDPQALARLIKGVPVAVDCLAGLERAISSAGGVCFEEIDDRYMLRARPGVFVAGEMLDWEAPTGGYLLQATFATGFAAGRGAARWISEVQSAAV